MKYSIDVDDRKFNQLMRDLKTVSENIGKEAAIVSWRTAKKTKSWIAKDVSKTIKATQRDIKELLTTRRNSSGSSLVRWRPKSLSAKDFKARQTKKHGVKFRVFKGGQYQTIPKGFMGPNWKTKNPKWKGHAFVNRSGKLQKVWGMNLGAWFRKKRVGPTVEEINKLLRAELKERIRYLRLKRSGAI